MSLGGMAIAIGSLVDDAIINVENVNKRLRQNRQKPPEERLSYFSVVFEASKEIIPPIVNATFIIIMAFLPLFFLSGMEGRMLQPLGISFVVAIFISLIVAMTLTPLLSKLLIANDKYLAKNEKEKWLVRKLSYYYKQSLTWSLKHKKAYKQSLTWSLKHKKAILLSTLGVFVVSLFVFSALGRSFLPEFNEGSLTISVVTKPSTSLVESNRLGNLVETELLSIPEISSTARRTGRGELDEHSQTTNSAEVDVNFDLKERSRTEFMSEVRETLARIPGIAVTVGQPLGHRIDHMLSGTRASNWQSNKEFDCKYRRFG